MCGAPGGSLAGCAGLAQGIEDLGSEATAIKARMQSVLHDGKMAISRFVQVLHRLHPLHPLHPRTGVVVLEGPHGVHRWH
jgi:hypothetical protein